MHEAARGNLRYDPTTRRFINEEGRERSRDARGGGREDRARDKRPRDGSPRRGERRRSRDRR